MTDYSRTEAAERAGIGVDDLAAQVDLGIVRPGAGDRFTSGDVRRAELVQSLKGAGISLKGLASALEAGTLSLDFLDAPVYERFSALSDVTFQQLSERTGVPIHLLLLIREAAGSASPKSPCGHRPRWRRSGASPARCRRSPSAPAPSSTRAISIPRPRRARASSSRRA